MRERLFVVCLLSALSLGVSPSGAQTQPGSTGGALLYQTYCIACHTKQIHWRDRKLAVDWPSLWHQVSRWQTNNALQWTDDQIDEVARYLNDSIYHFPDPHPRAENPLGRLVLSQARTNRDTSTERET